MDHYFLIVALHNMDVSECLVVILGSLDQSIDIASNIFTFVAWLRLSFEFDFFRSIVLWIIVPISEYFVDECLLFFISAKEYENGYVLHSIFLYLIDPVFNDLVLFLDLIWGHFIKE